MPNLGPFKHGVSWADVPTSVIAPVPAYPGINVVIGSSPLYTNPNGKDLVNVPLVFNSFADAVAALGYSDDWATYDISEHMDSVFVEYGMYPAIYIVVNDPEAGAVTAAPAPFTLVAGQVNTDLHLIAWDIEVTGPTGTPVYEEGVDYLVSYDSGGHVIITRLAGGAILTDTATIEVGGKTVSATPVTATDIIGGIDSAGKATGIQAVEDVFQKTGYVPGVLIAPNWSHNPLVAAALEAKCENINGCFACTCLIDVDTKTVKSAAGVLQWKKDNNITFARQELLFGKPTLTDAQVGTPGSIATVVKQFNFASQQGPLLQWTDTYKGGGLPYVSPSNKQLRMNALQDADGDEIPMHLQDANALNAQGVVTALNFIGGWRSWGNRTAAYPANSDVKDMFIAVRRMFDYIGNTVVLTIWQKVDDPGNRRLIDAVVNSLNLWLSSLANSDALVGARLEFNQSENPTTEILNGHYTFHIFIAVPTPAEWLDFKIEYWVPYINNLWPGIDQVTLTAA